MGQYSIHCKKCGAWLGNVEPIPAEDSPLRNSTCADCKRIGNQVTRIVNALHRAKIHTTAELDAILSNDPGRLLLIRGLGAVSYDYILHRRGKATGKTIPELLNSMFKGD